MRALSKLRPAGIVFALAASASAQLVIPPGETTAARAAFDSIATARKLRCEVHPDQPALTYAFEFRAGFTVDIPAKLLAGASRDLNVFVRVTPNQKEPVYLGMSGAIRNPEGKGDLELAGHFAVGEGSYRVEALVKDAVEGVCYGDWRIEANFTDSERQLAGIPAGAVLEQGGSGSKPSGMPLGPQIERLAIMVHATSATPNAATMEDRTISDLADTLELLLTRLPAKSVQLVVFNLDRRLVPVNKEPFRRSDLPEVIRAFEQLELALTDVKALQNRGKRDVLSDLLLKEQRNPHPASAVILLGPRTFEPTDPMIATELNRGSIPWFYLQYFPAALVSSPRPSIGEVSTVGKVTGEPATDGIEGLIRVAKGVTLPLSSPHDLAESIHRMDAAIAKRNFTVDPASPELAPPFEGDRNELGDLTGEEDPAAVLTTMRDRVLSQARGVPNHTCVETVQRDSYQLQGALSARSCLNVLAARKLRSHRLTLGNTEWLRLDVGMGVDREIFSWPGASAFEKNEFDRWLPDGAFGSGPFAAMLLSVLENRDPHFILDGETVIDGRRLLQYSFRVPPEDSHYRVKSRAGDWMVSSFSGALLVDPQTSNLVRFRVRTDELPRTTDNCQIDTTLDYNMVETGKFEYLLPVSARQRFVGLDGRETENKVSFAGCREFRGESSISFTDTPAAAVEPADKAERGNLPDGLILTIDLATSFTLGKAAAGDPIEGRLVEPLLDPSSKRVLAAAGARLAGRLTRAELRYGDDAEYGVGLRWETIELDGNQTPLNLKPKEQIASMEADGRRVLRRRGPRGERSREVGERDVLYLFPALPGAVESGLRTEWLTTSGH